MALVIRWYRQVLEKRCEHASRQSWRQAIYRMGKKLGGFGLSCVAETVAIITNTYAGNNLLIMPQLYAAAASVPTRQTLPAIMADWREREQVQADQSGQCPHLRP